MSAQTTVEIKTDTGRGFTVAGYGVVFGGADIVGDIFTEDTDFWFDRITRTPMVLYQHGQDESLKRTVVGRVTSITPDELGLWVEAQITAAKQYADAIRKLVKEGVLGWSSGSVPHLVQRTKGDRSGTRKITSWPIVELSLTPTPAEPRTIGVKELKSLATIDTALEPLLESLKQVEGSYEDLREDLCEAIGDLLGGMCNVIATFADYAIVTTNGENFFRVPYTLDSDGDPVPGTPESVSMSFTPMRDGSAEKNIEETKPYRIVMRNGQHCVVNPQTGKTMGCHDTREGAMRQQRALYANVPDASKAEQGKPRSDYAWVDADGTGHLDISDEGHVRAAMARFNQTHFTEDGAKRSAARKIIARARRMGIDVDPDSAVAQAAKGVNMSDLPDDAFGYVEPGFIDDAGKTSPRANRHFVHHDEDGNVDQALLEIAIAEAKSDPRGEYALSHLLRHASGEDDAHTKFWAHDSAAGQVLVVANTLQALSEEIITAQKHMDYLGYAKSAGRIQPEVRQALKECIAVLQAVEAHADQAESGDDGTARADYLRRRLALLEV